MGPNNIKTSARAPDEATAYFRFEFCFEDRPTDRQTDQLVEATCRHLKKQEETENEAIFVGGMLVLFIDHLSALISFPLHRFGEIPL